MSDPLYVEAEAAFAALAGDFQTFSQTWHRKVEPGDFSIPSPRPASRDDLASLEAYHKESDRLIQRRSELLAKYWDVYPLRPDSPHGRGNIDTVAKLVRWLTEQRDLQGEIRGALYRWLQPRNLEPLPRQPEELDTLRDAFVTAERLGIEDRPARPPLDTTMTPAGMETAYDVLILAARKQLYRDYLKNLRRLIEAFSTLPPSSDVTWLRTLITDVGRAAEALPPPAVPWPIRLIEAHIDDTDSTCRQTVLAYGEPSFNRTMRIILAETLRGGADGNGKAEWRPPGHLNGGVTEAQRLDIIHKLGMWYADIRDRARLPASEYPVPAPASKISPPSVVERLEGEHLHDGRNGHTYLKPAQCLDRLPLKALSERQKRHQLDKLLKRCPWVGKDEHGHPDADDFGALVKSLKRNSTSPGKANVSDAIDRMPTDPTPEQIEKMKADIKAGNLQQKRGTK